MRGNAYQVMEKYLAMARDASAAGDRIAMENYLQHAEHYYRMLNANGEANRGRPARADANGGGGQGNGVDGQQDDDAQPGNSLQSGPSGQGGLRTGAMAEPSEDSEA